MKFKLVTYKILKGRKEIVELIDEKRTQAVIYKDDKPSFFVDCFDLETESNVTMNSLVLCQKRNMSEVVSSIGKQNNVNIFIKKAPLVFLKKTFEVIELDLPPLPEEWLS